MQVRSHDKNVPFWLTVKPKLGKSVPMPRLKSRPELETLELQSGQNILK